MENAAVVRRFEAPPASGTVVLRKAERELQTRDRLKTENPTKRAAPREDTDTGHSGMLRIVTSAAWTGTRTGVLRHQVPQGTRRGRALTNSRRG